MAPEAKRVKVSAQHVHTRGPGELLTFGKGEFGQLGLGPEVAKRNYPSLVDLNGKKIIQVAAGGVHTVVLDEEGKVWTFGVNDDKALGRITEEEEDGFDPGVVTLPYKIVQISAGDSHSAALTEGGAVYAWGTFKDINGNFGLVPGGGATCRSTPELISKNIPGIVLKIASGDNHLVMLDDQGKVFTCGTGEQGQLGRSQLPQGRITRLRASQSMLASPVSPLDYLLTPAVVQIPRKKFRDIFAGSFSTYCRTERNSEIWVFGLNNYDQLGIKSSQGTQMIELPEKSTGFRGKKIVQIAAGQHHAICLDDEGRVYTLGRGDDGRLGLGLGASQSLSEPTLVPELRGIKCTHVSAGLSTGYAQTADGKLYAWGFGDNFQLGTGTSDDLWMPRPLKHIVVAGQKRDFEGKVKYVSGGGQHVAITLDSPMANGTLKVKPSAKTNGKK